MFSEKALTLHVNVNVHQTTNKHATSSAQYSIMCYEGRGT